MFILSFLKLGFDFIAGRAIALFNMRMQIATFIIDRWKPLLVAAILALGAIHYLSLRSQVTKANASKAIAQKALIEHVEADQALAKKREAENRLNQILAQKKTDAKEAEHQAELSLIVAKGKSNEIVSKRVITDLRSELRSRIEGYQAAGVFENDPSGLTSGDSHAAIFKRVQAELATCKEAGAIAAADYNFCYNYVQVQQSILGVQE